MHKSIDDFVFQSDPTTDYGVSCPLGYENIVSPGFLIHFNSDLLIPVDKQNWLNILFKFWPDHCFKFRITCL